MGQQVRLWIFAKDRDRAHTFYARVFGWSLPDNPRQCWLITDADDPRLGTDGPADSGEELIIPAVHVADLDATISATVAAGGEVLVPRIPLPGAGWLAYIADTEDNVISIMQDDPRAAWPAEPGPERRRDRRERDGH